MLMQVNKYIPEVYDRYFINDLGELFTDYGSKKMSDNSIQNGYIVNTLFGDNERINNVKRYRLVAQIFLPEPSLYQTQVNHINGIKTDNRVVNLEWCTSKENIRHAWNNHLSQARKGSENNWAKLTETQVLEIAKLLQDGKMMGKDIAELYNVHKGTISAIKTRKNWSDLTKDFIF